MPLAIDPVVIARVGVGAATTSVRVWVAVCTGLLVSFTSTETWNDPDAVGAPVNIPELPKVTPAGRLPPALVQVYGLVPPVALSVAE